MCGAWLVWRTSRSVETSIFLLLRFLIGHTIQLTSVERERERGREGGEGEGGREGGRERERGKEGGRVREREKEGGRE